jgi:hypothetical protein
MICLVFNHGEIYVMNVMDVTSEVILSRKRALVMVAGVVDG